MIANHATSWISWKREDGFEDAGAGVGFAGDGGESGGFTWFHGYAAEVYGSCQRAL
jgi:hypothetical protein